MSQRKTGPIRHAFERSLAPPRLYRWLRTPHVPLAFFVRNLAYLERETWFLRMSPASRRLWMAQLFMERVRCFRVVQRLIPMKHGEIAWPDSDSAPGDDPPPVVPGYCDHCGGCCEIASGLAEFPEESHLPDRWRVCFGEGLGAGHRFCAFMWEGEQAGTSLCAIHPWRANPCRVFEADDCEIFKQDWDFIAFSRSQRLSVLRRLLPRILRDRRCRKA